ncbi:hypothetical protein Q9L58_010518 [Maublancomyces gigas]|uniref:sn-1-specific diacylglycerol lipase n=1 Tax=Discina gigas TaxID=1032678 RepID=A0ABR3G3Y2_9PEZI
MGFLTKAVAAGVVRHQTSSSIVAGVIRSPKIEMFTTKAIARFLPAGHGDDLIELIDTLQTLFPGDLTVIELKSALFLLAILQAKRTQPAYTLKSTSDPEITAEFTYFIKYATAAYGKAVAIDPKSQWIIDHTGLKHANVQKYVDTKAVAGTHLAEHFVAVDTEKKSVILALMGTLTLAGVMKDLRSTYMKGKVWDEEYDVHTGMWKSAKALVEFPSLISQIKEGLETNPDFQLLIIGHSLGGGVAALVACLLAEAPASSTGPFVTNSRTIPGRKIMCYGFEPAPSFEESLSIRSRSMIFSIVNKNDIVPSLCHGAIEDFKIVATMLKNDTAYHAKLIDEILTNKLNADAHLAFFRTIANEKKLVPPGRLWSMTANKTGKMEVREILDVNDRFGEARFLCGMVRHHWTTDCVASLKAAAK